MKTLTNLVMGTLILTLMSCHKNKCNQVTITQTGTPCSYWGIRVNNHTYPADSIPSYYQQEGIRVCAKYELYEDMRACACCGGTWAKIISIRNPDE